MPPQFPIAVLTKDSKDLALYDSPDELEQGIEIIDVENEEYGGWDALGFEVNFFVNSIDAERGWLGIRRASAEPSTKNFIDAIRLFATREGIEFDPLPDEQPVVFLSRLESQIASKPRTRRNWWKRILGSPD